MLLPSQPSSEQADRQLLEGLLANTPFPIPVRTYTIELTTDDDGDAAFRITLTLEAAAPLPRRLATPLARFIDEVQDQAMHFGMSRWPYFEVARPVRRRKSTDSLVPVAPSDGSCSNLTDSNPTGSNQTASSPTGVFPKGAPAVPPVRSAGLAARRHPSDDVSVAA